MPELAAAEPSCVHGKPARLSWARLLKRAGAWVHAARGLISASSPHQAASASGRWDLLRPTLSEAGNGGSIIWVHP